MIGRRGFLGGLLALVAAPKVPAGPRPWAPPTLPPMDGAQYAALKKLWDERPGSLRNLYDHGTELATIPGITRTTFPRPCSYASVLETTRRTYPDPRDEV